MSKEDERKGKVIIDRHRNKMFGPFTKGEARKILPKIAFIVPEKTLVTSINYTEDIANDFGGHLSTQEELNEVFLENKAALDKAAGRV